MQIIF